MSVSKLNVHSIESFGSVDGPGIRFIIFLKGCRMRCRYCHNPDTWRLADGHDEAMSVNELLDKAERYRAYWGEEGGITVSGGEALLQIDGLIALFEEAHRRGISTCLDTAAQPFSRTEPFFGKFVRLMKATDTVLLDLKHFDSERHKWLTGHDNDNILDCARCLSELGVPVWIRHVLVPGITDDRQCGEGRGAALPYAWRIQVGTTRTEIYLGRRADTVRRTKKTCRGHTLRYVRYACWPVSETIPRLSARESGR